MTRRLSMFSMSLSVELWPPLSVTRSLIRMPGLEEEG